MILHVQDAIAINFEMPVGEVTESITAEAGAAINPSLPAFCSLIPALIDIPFFVAGTLKIAYDLVLYRERPYQPNLGRVITSPG